MITSASALGPARVWAPHPDQVPAQLVEQRPDRIRGRVLDRALGWVLAQELAE